METYKAWLLASRPKTLAGAVAPVLVGLAAAWATTGGRLLIVPALLCMGFALLMQVDSNLVNDYLDFRNGVDGADRLGPPRACAQGWISPRAMRRGIGVVTLLACLAGLPLVVWAGWIAVAVGMACVAACFLYSVVLARLGLGDVLVVVFFGLVPVSMTYYLQTMQFTVPVLQASLAMGLVTDCLLLVNNYRDRETDRAVGKRTLVVLLGAPATEWLYLALGILAVVLVARQSLLPLLFLSLHVRNWRLMRDLHDGAALNMVLGRTAFAILFFALMYSVGQILRI